MRHKHEKTKSKYNADPFFVWNSYTQREKGMERNRTGTPTAYGVE